MAHVGTTNGINQPAATGSGGQAGLWMALIAGAVIVAIALAFGTTQGTGSRPVIVAQRAPAVIVAPGAWRLRPSAQTGTHGTCRPP